MHLLSRLAFFFALALLPVAAQAQQAGPTMAAARSGFQAPVSNDQVSPQEAVDAAARSGGLGTGGALMIVGGVAFVAGLIIGGGVGTALAVGGVLVAAYGLYVFLK
jgi:hypothetical protein